MNEELSHDLVARFILTAMAQLVERLAGIRMFLGSNTVGTIID